ncbi:MAG: universal stress protein [Chloroflexi bacterium]|nr:universal stress protein [Chloroflexota bacterium]
MGSVTDKVVQSATSPVLVYRAHTERQEEEYRLSSILVPLDGSKLSEEILPTAAFLAQALKLEIILVMATPTASYLAQGLEIPSQVDIFFEDLSKQSSEYLEGVQQRLSELGLSSVSVHTSMGRAARVIIETARSRTDNMVVMTTHGRSGLKRWAMGSVTDQVVRHCGDPVLVLRPSGDR